jgi:hypothetical protein
VNPLGDDVRRAVHDARLQGHSWARTAEIAGISISSARRFGAEPRPSEPVERVLPRLSARAPAPRVKLDPERGQPRGQAFTIRPFTAAGRSFECALALDETPSCTTST